MPITVDRKRGRYNYTSEESPPPPEGVATEEHVKGWMSKDPQYQNDLPEQPNYSEVVGDNQIITALAYQMNHTGRRFVRSRPGKPYGRAAKQGGLSVNVPAGGEVDLGSITGYGWLLGLNVRVDYSGLALNLYRDAELIFNNVVIDDMFAEGVTIPVDNYLQVTRYNSKDDIYTAVWDPAQPYYYNGKIRLTIANPDGSPHTVLLWSIGFYTNPR